MKRENEAVVGILNWHNMPRAVLERLFNELVSVVEGLPDITLVFS